jgi:hypothetical protein
MPWSLGTDIRSVPFTSLNRPHAINVLPTLDLCGPTALFCLRNHSHFFLATGRYPFLQLPRRSREARPSPVPGDVIDIPRVTWQAAQPKECDGTRRCSGSGPLEEPVNCGLNRRQQHTDRYARINV